MKNFKDSEIDLLEQEFENKIKDHIQPPKSQTWKPYKEFIKSINKTKLKKQNKKVVDKLTKNLYKDLEKEQKKEQKRLLKEIKSLSKELNMKKSYKNLKKAYDEAYQGKRKFDYFLRIKFYKVGNIEEDDEENKVDEYDNNKNKDVELDQSGNIYYNIWKYPLTIKLSQNPTELKINKFYNTNDDGVEFIHDSIDMFIQDKQFEKDYYQHFKSYISGFIITSISKIDSLSNVNLKPIEKNKYKLDDDNIALYNKFTKYNINDNGTTLKELISMTFSNDYLKNNYRKNCCFLTAIINKFYNRFNTRTKDGIRRHKELTYEFLCTFLKLENKESDIECTIEQAKTFFE